MNFLSIYNAQFDEMIILAIILLDKYVILGMITILQGKKHFPFPINSCMAWCYEYEVQAKCKINHGRKIYFWQGNLGVH